MTLEVLELTAPN